MWPSACFPMTWVRNTAATVQKKLVQMNYLFWVAFWGGLSSSDSSRPRFQKGVSTRLWCVPGFGGFCFQLEPSKLQKYLKILESEELDSDMHQTLVPKSLFCKNRNSIDSLLGTKKGIENFSKENFVRSPRSPVLPTRCPGKKTLVPWVPKIVHKHFTPRLPKMI